MTIDGKSAARVLSEYCHSLKWGTLPPDVQERARELVLDYLGVTIRGSREPSSAPVAALAGNYSGRATVVGGFVTTSAPWAALANGTAGHAIEMDDVTRASSLHPGVAVIPGAAAVAEETGSTASQFLTAVVVGYEVTMRVGNALNPASTYKRGFHPTSVAGTFGAAMAAGYLLGLDVPQLTHALGIAGTMAAGSLEYLAGGAWSKRLNPGWAAHAGVVAAMLAQNGFTGPATVFEGKLGLLTAYSDDPYPDQLLRSIGDHFQIMDVSVKPYAGCRYNHGLIDCMLALREQHRLQVDEIESIRLGVLSAGALLVATPLEKKRDPQNVVDAQFSAPFAAALAFVSGSAGVDQYGPHTLSDPAIRALMARTVCYQDDSLDSAYPERWPAAVEITTRSGRALSHRVEYPLGDPENPISHDNLLRKFASLVGDLLSVDPLVLAQRILHMEDATPVRDVLALCSTAPRDDVP